MTKRGAKLGHWVTVETRKKISDSIKAKWQNPDYRKIMISNHKGMLGKKHTEEWRRKMCGHPGYMRGKKHDEGYSQRQSKLAKAKGFGLWMRTWSFSFNAAKIRS